jgi:hypothetical protein
LLLACAAAGAAEPQQNPRQPIGLRALGLPGLGLVLFAVECPANISPLQQKKTKKKKSHIECQGQAKILFQPGKSFGLDLVDCHM